MTDLERLSRRVAELEQLVARAAGRERETDETTGQAVRDAMWKCRKCASLLAFYDRAEDVLRIRYKEHLTYVHVGEGGWVQVVCRSCGEPNLQGYVTAAEVEAAAQQASKGRASPGTRGALGG